MVPRQDGLHSLTLEGYYDAKRSEADTRVEYKALSYQAPAAEYTVGVHSKRKGNIC